MKFFLFYIIYFHFIFHQSINIVSSGIPAMKQIGVHLARVSIALEDHYVQIPVPPHSVTGKLGYSQIDFLLALSCKD